MSIYYALPELDNYFVRQLKRLSEPHCIEVIRILSQRLLDFLNPNYYSGFQETFWAGKMPTFAPQVIIWQDKT